MVVLSLVLMRSTKESGALNMVMVVVHLLLIAFVIFAGEAGADAGALSVRRVSWPCMKMTSVKVRTKHRIIKRPS